MIKERVMQCLEENGIVPDEAGNLMDVDSVVFISAVLTIEEEFGIEFPDEYLSITYFSNIDDIIEIINGIQVKETEK